MWLVGVDDDSHDLFKRPFRGADIKRMIEAKRYLDGMMIMGRRVYGPADIHKLPCPKEKI
jgi:hypothetical protein